MERLTPDDVILDPSPIYSRADLCSIYKAKRRTMPSQDLCVKKMLISQENDANNMLSECISMASARHSNIIRLYSVYLDEKDYYRRYIYIFMEYFPEGDLDKLIVERSRKRDYWSQNELFEFAYQLISPLEFLQQNNISHRDIKPANILITNDRKTLKIADFGSSRCITTQTLSIIGTPIFLSPIVRKAYSESLLTGVLKLIHNPYKSDVFSLGLTFLNMASLRSVADLAVIPGLESKIEDRINNLPNEYFNFKLLIKSMLVVDENKRFDFIELLKNFQAICAIQYYDCSGCGNSFIITDFYRINNERMCRICVKTFDPFPSQKLICEKCKTIIDPTMQCDCTGDGNRCSWCKDLDHMNYSCLDNMSQSVRNQSYSISMVCSCGNLMNLHPDYFYFFCESCGYFCVGCGKKSNESNHEVCKFMQSYYYLIRRVT
ncbi:hypothetical protein SteCoe_36214 [Stentor coeruleus]|uniref:Protein kinase domain-containing protein n=1 Tax=Stentor coeruleus TaxID=5963 RepID=A0A1R2AQM3_9CILI|nr:hypothetical protein SteCoe_36214 [Stentor coeruleus]